MKLKDIARTATFAWDASSSSSPLLATGAVAGALDESFSDESQLEIWEPEFGESKQGYRLGKEGKGPKGSISVGSRFNRLAWSVPLDKYSRGILAAGMETGEINLYDPAKILAGSSGDDARIFKSEKHTGPVRGLDFNPIQKNLLLSGALYIYDLNNPSKDPLPPGPNSTKLGEITNLQWNPTVARIFAASSSSGYTSVWDLKAGKEVASLQYGGGAARGAAAVRGASGLEMGKRRGMSDVCWHPESATRLITASEDDESPVIMLWDLRNVRAPERILSGHTKGVLSVSWCAQDADLLVSCGKDNRTICWNPQTGEIVGELPLSNDWAFQTNWNPRNPDLLATASFDGHIGIHSLQTTTLPQEAAPPIAENVTDDDVFGALGAQEEPDQTANVLSLQQPPKWLRRPVSATFGFGGLLASTSNLPGSSGKHQSGVVHLRHVVTEQEIIDRANALQETAGDKGQMATFCEGRAGDAQDAAWKTLQTLFKADSRDDLVALLGFSKTDVAQQVQKAIEKLPGYKAPEETPETPAAETEDGIKGDVTPPARRPSLDGQTTPSERSVKSGSTKDTGTTAATELGLFDDETHVSPGGGPDFFSSMAAGAQLRNPALDSIIPHKAEVAESSVAATIGSRASSFRSEAIKDHTFRIYPSGESETDKLITQALVLGNFASAVELCMASERFADALLLAVRGGPELLQTTQKAYFARRTTKVPFLRVFQSIVTEDLIDIVQNADLEEWKVAFVVLCTFAKDGDFANLADQLGQRLQYKWLSSAGSDSSSPKRAREDATLCHLAARKLEKVVSIWAEEMREEEESSTQTRYTAHAQALQSFIEKVTVFAAATGYVDEDLLTPTQDADAADAGARTYKLAPLYDRYYEYADLLATQGLVDLAAKYVQMTPTDYKGTGAAGSELDKARDRLLQAAGLTVSGTSVGVQALGLGAGKPAQPAVGGRTSSYAPVTATRVYAPQQQAAPIQPFGGQGYQPAPQQLSAPQSQQSQPYGSQQYGGYNSGMSNPYAPSQNTSNQPYGAPSNNPYAPSGPSGPSGPANGYGIPSDPQPQGYGLPPTGPMNPYGMQQPNQPIGPPRMGSLSGANNASTPPPIPAAQRRDIPGWNDAPSFSGPKRPQSAASKEVKPAPIMSPFPVDPNAPQVPAYGAPPQGPPQGMSQGFSPQGPPQGQGQYGQPPQQQPGQSFAPPPPPAGPPRSGSTGQPGLLPPPPKGGPRPPSAQKVAQAASGMPAGPPPPQQQQQQQQQRPPPPQGLGVGGSPQGLQGQSPGGRAGPPPQQFQQQQLQARPPPPPGAMAGPPPPRAMSPLNPAAQAGRTGSPFALGQQQGVRPPPHGAPQGAQRTLSPPQQYQPPAGQAGQGGGFGLGGPPPPGARTGGGGPTAGPPPPGQGRSGTAGIASAAVPQPQPIGQPQPQLSPAAAVAATNPPAQPSPAVQQESVKPKHPSGDRSHIPPSDKAIYETLHGQLEVVKQANLPPALKRIVDDTERRLNVLFDALNNATVPKDAVALMQTITKSVAAKDYNAALATHVELLTNATGETTAWAPGVKQLIRLSL